MKELIYYPGQDYDRLKFRKTYDWVDAHSDNRTPEDYPYGFSPYWLQRPEARVHAEWVYSDRMSQWDYEKFKHARQESEFNISYNFNFEACKKLIQIYYEGKYQCVGYALCCNVSSGYPIGMFALAEYSEYPRKETSHGN